MSGSDWDFWAMALLSAKIAADINCGSAVVSGEVTGNIAAAGSVELQRGAHVKGDISTPTLAIDKGAVLKIDEGGLSPLALADSDKVQVGDIVLAIGNPLGIGQTVTLGIISAKSRRTGLSNGSFEDFLQTDAPINRGNSGGALVNSNGDLVGINSQILSPSGGSIGIGFSIPSNMARDVLDQLVKNGKVTRGQLGVVVQPVTEDIAGSLKLNNANGVIVSQVQPGSAAERAGLKRGDVILALNGNLVSDPNSFRNEIAGTPPGRTVTLRIWRDGSEQELRPTLGEFVREERTSRPTEKSSPERGGSDSGRLGLAVQPLTPALASQLGIGPDTQGLVVVEVDPFGPAADAGIQRGDVIEQVNQQPVRSVADLRAAVERAGQRADAGQRDEQAVALVADA